MRGARGGAERAALRSIARQTSPIQTLRRQHKRPQMRKICAAARALMTAETGTHWQL